MYSQQTTEARQGQFRNLKRKLIVGALMVGTLGIVGVAGATYGVYRLVGASVSAVDRTLAQVEVPDALGLDGFALGMVDDWMASALREGNTVGLYNGLSCLAAIGGPSPQRALEALKSRAGGTATGMEAERVLGELREQLERQPTDEPQAASCLRLVVS